MKSEKISLVIGKTNRLTNKKYFEEVGVLRMLATLLPFK